MAFEGRAEQGVKESSATAADDLSSGQAFSDAARHLASAISQARIYLQTLIDRAKIVARSLLLIVILGIVAAIVAATILICATVFFCCGIANGISALLGGRAWAGDLITGILVLGTLAIAAKVFVTRLTRSSRKQTMKDYGERLPGK